MARPPAVGGLGMGYNQRIAMPSYAFILGRTPALSIAEICRLLGVRQASFRIQSMTEEALAVDLPDSFDVRPFFAELGGSVKVAEVVDEFPPSDLPAALEERLTMDRLLGSVFPQSEREIPFGVSLYGIGERERQTLGSEMHRWLMAVKRELSKHGFRGRVVEDRSGQLSSASVGKNRLVELGAELLVIADSDRMFLGRTVAVQAFEEFSEADYGRPRRNSEAGMLPPKLGRMMLNLTGVDRLKARLLDPFCGSGTVVTEAIQLGFKDIAAVDASKEAVAATNENVEWMLKRSGQPFDGAEITYLVSSIRDLPNRLGQQVDAIVTEPNLGPALRTKPDREAALGIMHDLRKLYVEAFDAFRRLLRTGGALVIVLPVIRTKGGGELTLELPPSALNGFTSIDPFPSDIPRADFLPKAGEPIRYFRPGQRVERDITVFERK